MADPLDSEFTAQNPIVAAANRIREQRMIDAALRPDSEQTTFEDAQSGLMAFAAALTVGIKRLNAIVGERHGVKLIRLEKPLRLRVRFREKRVALDLDDIHQLIIISGEGFDGEWQFDPQSDVPALMNLSKLSSDEGYGERLTASTLLRLIAEDAQLPRPPELDAGPLQF